MRRRIAFLAAVLALTGCGREAPHADEHGAEPEVQHTDQITLSAEQAEIAGIEIGEVIRRPLQAELTVPGVVASTAAGRAVVTPPVSGRVTRLLVKPGDRVRAGQAIALLQSSELVHALAGINDAQRALSAAKAAVKQAKSEVDLGNSELRTARQTLARQQQLARAGAFSQAPLQAAQRELNEAEAELKTAEQEEVVHRAQLERAERLYKLELISRTELEQARLEVQTDEVRQEKARRQIEIARAAFERERQIAGRGLLSAKEVQTAEAEVRTSSLELERAKLRVRAAEAEVASAEQGLRHALSTYAAVSGGTRAIGSTATIVAPINGVVVDMEATLGQALDRTSEICEIENLQTVLITASVPQKSIALARVGAQAQITTEAFPNRMFVGTVQVVGTRLDPKTRSMPVQVLVDNSSRDLRTGMFAEVQLGIGVGEAVLAVPASAVVRDGDHTLVFIALGEGKYQRREVRTGRKQGQLMEISRGIELNERIVTKGGFVLLGELKKGDLKGHEH